MGRTLGVARRLGKHMWWEMHGGGAKTPESLSPLFHFGMTGAMSVKGEGASKYKSFVVDTSSWPPRFAKLVVTFDNGVSLAYTDPRRFGRVRLVAGDVEASPPISDLGFDPLLAMPPDAEFAAMYAARAAPIKAALLDQKIAAGVGNWIADEVLYHAGVHPETRAKDLSRAQLSEIRRAMGFVVETACRAGADAELFPSDWLFHHRWGKVAGKVGGKPISFITVGGRTTAFVAAVQKKGDASAAKARRGRRRRRTPRWGKERRGGR